MKTGKAPWSRRARKTDPERALIRTLATQHARPIFDQIGGPAGVPLNERWSFPVNVVDPLHFSPETWSSGSRRSSRGSLPTTDKGAVMGSEEQVCEERRRQLIHQIGDEARKAGFPDYDVASRLAGHLAGPASKDRPDVPVWQYLDYAATEPNVTVEDIIRVRFPITFYEERSTVTSIAEELQLGPTWLPVSPTAADIVRFYAMLHDAGVLGWNSATRTIEQLKPQSSYMKVFKDWWNQLLDQAGYEGPRP